MAKQPLTQDELIKMARDFCEREHFYPELYGVTDGKAVGTFVERKFQEKIEESYSTKLGTVASGLDLPEIETDIIVLSVRQTLIFTPFRSARQKIYGLGYNLLLFVYEKEDDADRQLARLSFIDCAFIEKHRTGDYLTTNNILKILELDGNREDLIAFFYDRYLVGDEVVYNALADEILQNPPALGSLVISKNVYRDFDYCRIVPMNEAIPEVVKIT